MVLLFLFSIAFWSAGYVLRRQKFIGLSLSSCALSIARGSMKIEDVLYVTTGTRCLREEHWEEVFDIYWTYYWRTDASDAEEAARALIASGRVKQPRLWGRSHCSWANGSPWVRSPKDIIWSPERSWRLVWLTLKELWMR